MGGGKSAGQFMKAMPIAARLVDNGSAVKKTTATPTFHVS